MVKCLIAFVLVIAIAAASPPHNSAFNDNNQRIYRGSAAVDGQFPYNVAIQGTDRGGLVCGASIIDHEWVVTAAHCIIENKPSDLRIYAGAVDFNSGGTIYAVKEIHYNENFTNVHNTYDMAILKVDYITYNDKIRPLVLETEDIGGDVSSVVTGWGANENDEYPDNLQYLNVTTVISESCYDYEICTLAKEGEGICDGDSGGPLVRQVDGIFRQIGIVSWIYDCDGGLGLPSGFVKVSYFIDWFREKCNKCF